MDNEPASRKPSIDALAALSVDELLHRLQLNYGYAQFVGVSAADLHEREEILVALTSREVPGELIDAAVHRGCREGAIIARDQTDELSS